jgi:hypothetical protein
MQKGSPDRDAQSDGDGDGDDELPVVIACGACIRHDRDSQPAWNRKYPALI